jgi:FkbM family methyltransferase
MASPISLTKRLIQSLAGTLGYEIVRKNRRGWNPDYLHSLSDPDVVIDVGAAYGTPKLYRAFSKSKFILVEPLQEYEDALEKWRNRIDCKIVYEAVGSRPGEVSIHVDPRRPTMSSVVKRSPLTECPDPGELRTVPLTTIDVLADKHCESTDCFVLKIDIEGMELEALQGSTETLKRTDLVIVETSVARCYENESDVFSVLDYVRPQGFRLYDILVLAYYQSDPGLMWVDLVLARDDHLAGHRT